MAVIRYRIAVPLVVSPPAETEVFGWEGGPDEVGAVRALAEFCRVADAGVGPAVRPEGLLGELRSRPGRRVDAWLAVKAGSFRSRDAGPEVPEVAAAALGLVTLVENSRGFSVGWLVVHPAWRRRGLARALVATAAAAAESRGALTLAADTLSGWRAASAFWSALGTVR